MLVGYGPRERERERETKKILFGKLIKEEKVNRCKLFHQFLLQTYKFENNKE